MRFLMRDRLLGTTDGLTRNPAAVPFSAGEPGDLGALALGSDQRRSLCLATGSVLGARFERRHPRTAHGHHFGLACLLTLSLKDDLDFLGASLLDLDREAGIGLGRYQ